MNAQVSTPPNESAAFGSASALAASALPAAGMRLLAQMVEHALRQGWRSADEFVQHFPPEVLVARLKDAPDLRLALLSAATGMHERILRRKSTHLAAQDLRVALELGLMRCEQVLEVLTPLDRVRYLRPERLWEFLVGDNFWRLDDCPTEEREQAVHDRLVFTLEQAVRERIVSLRSLFDALGYGAIAEALPPAELRRVVRFALARGRDGLVLSERALSDVLPLSAWVARLPLERTWQHLILEKIAIPCGITTEKLERAAGRWFEPVSMSAVPSSQALSPPAPLKELRPAPAAPTAEERPPYPAFGRSAADRQSVEESLDPAQLPPLSDEPEPEAPAPSLAPEDFAPELDDRDSSAAAAESENLDRERELLVNQLAELGRLPPSHPRLAMPTLRSIRTMYEALDGVTDASERAQIVRRSYAGGVELRAAMLALIELLDGTVDTADPAIRRADLDSLIQVLLFEEQRRAVGSARPPSSY